MVEVDRAAILFPEMAAADRAREQAQQQPAPHSEEARAEALFGEKAKAAEPKYVSPFDAKPEAKQPDQQPKAPADPAAVKAAADQLTKDLHLDAGDPLSSEVATEFATLGLNKDQSSKLVELNQKHSTSYWEKTWSGWAAEAQKLPADDIRAAQGFVKQYGDADLIELLDNYGIGNHPALIKAFARAAKGR